MGAFPLMLVNRTIRLTVQDMYVVVLHVFTYSKGGAKRGVTLAYCICEGMCNNVTTLIFSGVNNAKSQRSMYSIRTYMQWIIRMQRYNICVTPPYIH